MSNSLKASNIIQISNQALQQINSLTEYPVEIIFIIDINGGVSILEGNKERTFLVKDKCSEEKLILEPPKESCDTDNFVIGEFVARKADEKTINNFTVAKTAKPGGTGSIGYTLLTESGWAATSRGYYCW
jgi:hypothetical protein